MEIIDEKKQVELLRHYKRLEAIIASSDNENEIRKIRQEADLIKNCVIGSNLPFITKLVDQNISRNKVELREELTSELYERLMQCFNAYNPDNSGNMTFCHYTSLELRRKIKKHRVALVRGIPLRYYENLNKINIVRNQLASESKRDVSRKEVADAMKIRVEDINGLLDCIPNVLSLDKPITHDQDDDASLYSLIENNDTIDPYEMTASDDFKEQLAKKAHLIKPQNRVYLSLKFKGASALWKPSLNHLMEEFPVVEKRIKNAKKKLLSEGVAPQDIDMFETFFDLHDEATKKPIDEILRNEGL
jgi:DNA-directed RNA polymerase sigma subunit (sigma70/sigma32)